MREVKHGFRDGASEKLQIEPIAFYGRIVRKWGAIAVVLVAATLVMVVVLAPREDSIEYHLKEYRNAARRVQGHRRLAERICDLFNPKFTSEHLHKQSQHERALVRLGYLEDRTFIIANLAEIGRSNAFHGAFTAMQRKGTNTEFFYFGFPATNALRFVTIKENMPSQEEVLREIESATKTNR